MALAISSSSSCVPPPSEARRLRPGAGLERLVASRAFAYPAIAAVQLKIVWDVWSTKDLTPGDTSSYFVGVAAWAHHLQDNLAWSPLYTSGWGAVQAALGDVYASSMVVRLGIVLAATLLVLAVGRALLGPAIGLLVGVWWAVLAPNYGVLYDVHLLGVLPILAAVVLLARSQSRRALGAALGILAGTTLLLRNELVIATALLLGAVALWERRRRGTAHATPAPVAYGVPLLIVVAALSLFYARSEVQGSALRAAFRAKHTLNVCQVYAYNFQQRHPAAFTGNPFIDCHPLMREKFGRDDPTLVQATLANPGAIAGFVAWNGRLAASGLQVALLGATSTGDEPDYVPVERHRSYALVLSVLLAALLAAGAVAIRGDPVHWRRWWAARAWAIGLLGAIGVTTLVVMLTQRPRPEYMYGLTVGLMVCAGAALQAIARRRRWADRLAVPAVLMPIVVVIAVPSHYRGQTTGRPILHGVRRLEPVRDRLTRPGSVLVADAWGGDTCRYLAEGYHQLCSSPAQQEVIAQARAGSWAQTLRAERASVVYVSEALAREPEVAAFVARAPRDGWAVVSSGRTASGPWSVLVPAGAAPGARR